MIESGTRVTKTAYAFESRRKQLGLPDMVRNVQGDGKEMFYQEINPELNTETRLKGINALLSQIGYKVGFSNGYFVFNETSGIQTATQVEAEQQRTIQLIKDVRDKLESCLNGLIYALNVFADLYGLAPSGTYEVTYDFSDITYSFEEERAHHYQLAIQGHFPWEEYYVRFLGYAPEEAKRLLKMAKSEQRAPSLFGSEE
jgi:A118 family predicted phage portal protein